MSQPLFLLLSLGKDDRIPALLCKALSMAFVFPKSGPPLWATSHKEISGKVGALPTITGYQGAWGISTSPS